MRVFMTGGTGYLGKAIVRALLKAGHEIVALSRSEASSRRLLALGAQPHRGELADPRGFAQALRRCDAAVHAAIEHGPEAVTHDRGLVDAFIEAATAPAGPKQLVYTSGVLVLGRASDADERASTEQPFAGVVWRVEHERRLQDGVGDRGRVAVIRPGYVYGQENGIIGGYFESAIARGAAEYIGDGQNHMAMVHVDDLAQLYRLVLEKQARGIFHGVDEKPVRIIELATAASEAAGKQGAARSISIEEARAKLGVWAEAPCVDQTVVCPRAHELGWSATRPVLPDGVRLAYAEWKASRG